MSPRVRLTEIHGSFAAQVLQARLADEGIDADLRGPVDSPYRFTVGDLARIEVLVAPEQLDDAAYVLLANDVDRATELPELRFGRAVRWPALVVIAALIVAAASPALRYFAL